jgi:hypothetical protein
MKKTKVYEYLKQYIISYAKRKTHDPMMLRVFRIILHDLESDIITEIKRKELK